MSTPSPIGTPKINQRQLVRTAILLFVLAGLFATYRVFSNVKDDIQGTFAKVDSKGMIAAIEATADGSQVVVFGKDGSKKTLGGAGQETIDRDLAWRPDGNFIFFVSNRKENAFHIFRWNPLASEAEARTVGSRGRSNPTFPPDASAGDERLLMVSGGNVLELDPKKKQTPQILPPTTSEITVQGGGDEQGTEGLFASIYRELGESFRIARYFADRRFIAAIMRRSDGGETLVIQDMEPDEKGKLRPPLPLAAGERIDFDIDAKSSRLVYAVQGFRWPRARDIPKQFINGNKVTVPYECMLAVLDPNEKAPPVPIAISNSSDAGFGSPSVSPDGQSLLLIVGTFERGVGLTPKALLTLPLQENGIEARSILKQGDVADPTWSKDGSKIAFTLRQNGARDIITMSKIGAEEKNLTGGKGSYSQPKFSPQG